MNELGFLDGVSEMKREGVDAWMQSASFYLKRQPGKVIESYGQ